MDVDYEREYDKALATGADAVEAMQAKLDRAEQLIRALIRAEGGCISVSRMDIVMAPEYDLLQEDDLENDGWKFRVRVKP